mmetsp:Transcript_6593/g.15764  ORF Transcript_6593/g.15764 Transcript_6593/m.15764 type:complete len:271 (+) Transcript_6593:3312-4124(+)
MLVVVVVVVRCRRRSSTIASLVLAEGFLGHHVRIEPGLGIRQQPPRSVRSKVVDLYAVHPPTLRGAPRHGRGFVVQTEKPREFHSVFPAKLERLVAVVDSVVVVVDGPKDGNPFSRTVVVVQQQLPVSLYLLLFFVEQAEVFGSGVLVLASCCCCCWSLRAGCLWFRWSLFFRTLRLGFGLPFPLLPALHPIVGVNGVSRPNKSRGIALSNDVPKGLVVVLRVAGSKHDARSAAMVCNKKLVCFRHGRCRAPVTATAGTIGRRWFFHGGD